MRSLETHLRATVRGQDHAMPRVAAAFVRGELGLTDPARPRSSCLFAGPTGSGKTMAFATAVEHVCGPGALITFDMSEYQHPSAVQKLLGEDRSDSGLLGRAMAKVPAGGILFDEIEKAHPLVMDLFLQILWDGRVTVATGETFRFANYHVGLTTNVGAVESMRMAQSKFASIEQAVLRRLEQSLRPELLARIDESVVFARLTPEVQREICLLEVRRERARLQGVGYDVEVSTEAVEILVREGFHPQLGARPLRRLVERTIQNRVAAFVLTGVDAAVSDVRVGLRAME